MDPLERPRDDYSIPIPGRTESGAASISFKRSPAASGRAKHLLSIRYTKVLGHLLPLWLAPRASTLSRCLGPRKPLENDQAGKQERGSETDRGPPAIGWQHNIYIFFNS